MHSPIPYNYIRMIFFCSTKTCIEIWDLLRKVDSLHVDYIAFMNLRHLPIFCTSLLSSKFQIPQHRAGLSTSKIEIALSTSPINTAQGLEGGCGAGHVLFVIVHYLTLSSRLSCWVFNPNRLRPWQLALSTCHYPHD
jgi:hypothetical protein